MSSDLIAAIAIRAAVESGHLTTLSYRVPVHLRPLVQPGQLVWVPLRRQQVQGVVVDLFAPTGDAGERELRDVADIGDPEATLTPAGLQLARWVARTYRSSLYEVLALLLPPGAAQQAEITWRPTQLGMRADLGGLPVRERGVLYYLRQHGETSERALRKELRGADGELLAAYADLAERGLLARGAAVSAPRAQPRVIRLVRLLLRPAELDAPIAELARAPKQAAALRWLAAFATQRAEADDAALPAMPLAAVAEASGTDTATMRALQRRGHVAFEYQEVRRDPLAGDGVVPDVPPPLTASQRDALGPILDALDKVTRWQGEGATSNGETSVTQRGGSTNSPVLEHTVTLSPSHLVTSTNALNASQQQNVFLLHGVTGSGKTEVYLRAIGRALRLGRQVLVLVPEIALTAQLVRRFAARFPGQVAVLHSGLSLGQRYDEWRRLRRGDATIAIGSRSAVFAPLPHLGLLIVDEEHEPTYKHDAAPRYHARDAALQLAALTGSVTILGSATPSVESYYAAREGRYCLLQMRERVGTLPSVNGMPRSQPLPLPPVHIVDMRREIQTGNRSIFSRPLQEAIDGALGRNEQVILFLNRRGAASFIMCRDCGHVLSCGVCSGPLTVHYEEGERQKDEGGRMRAEGETPPQGAEASSERSASTFNLHPSSLLICHSCNHRELPPLVCPQCLSTRIKAFGIGTQRVEEEVLRLFPGARPLRWDKDSASRKGSHQRMLDTFLRHEADVLVGTQMIAKGLDLPLVSLVGVVAADTGLHLPDFRSGERSFQLLTQVAGRAGRRSAGAQVILQSYVPEHYALLAAREHDYAAFYQQEIAFRQQTGYPPFGRMVRFVYSSGSDERCAREARELAQRLSALLNARDDGDACGIVGPAPAFMQRVRGRFRWHLLLRAPDPAPILDALGPLYGWMVDVDPVNVL